MRPYIESRGWNAPWKALVREGGTLNAPQAQLARVGTRGGSRADSGRRRGHRRQYDVAARPERQDWNASLQLGYLDVAEGNDQHDSVLVVELHGPDEPRHLSVHDGRHESGDFADDDHRRERDHPPQGCLFESIHNLE